MPVSGGHEMKRDPMNDWVLRDEILAAFHRWPLIVMFVLVGLFIFLQFLDEVSRVGTGNYGFFDMVLFLILSTPRVVYEIFPMSALLGTMLGLSSLAVDSELIVMRAAGISIMGIAGSVMKSAAHVPMAHLDSSHRADRAKSD